ncbi:MAG: PAS domain S-box protein, partial [Bacteroidota bacterium]|nr:PAS domain S-box protein [Bacteroidota bacterium]
MFGHIRSLFNKIRPANSHKEVFVEQPVPEKHDMIKDFFENSPSAMAVSNKDTTIFTVNKAFCNMFDMNREKAIGESWTNFIPPDQLPFLREKFQLIFKDPANAQTELEYKFKTKAGETKWLLLSVSLIPGIKKLVATFKDISKRKLLEEEKSRQFYITGKSLNEIYVFDAVTLKFEYLNQSALHNLGYTLDELKDETPILIKPEFTEASFRMLIEPLMSGSQEYLVFDTIHRRKDGSDYFVEVHLQLYLQENKKVLFAVVNDMTERRQSDSALKKSHELVETMVNNLRGVVFRCENDDNWTMKYISSGINELSGYTAEEFIENSTRTYSSIIEPADRSMVACEIKKNISRKEPYTVEYRIRTVTGEQKWVWERGRGVFEKDQLIALEGFISDITELKQTEEALIKSKKEFQSYFDYSSAGLTVTAPDSKWIEVNQRLCRMLGYTKEELTGKSWLDFSVQDDIDTNMDLFNQALEGKIDYYELEKRFIRKDGNVIDVSLSTVCQRNDDGTVNHFLTSLNDVTERKKSEKLNRTLGKAIEQSPDSIVITNAEGKIEFVNAQYIAFMQYSLEEVKGEMPHIFQKKNVSAELYDLMWKTLHAGKVFRCENFLNRKKDGTSFFENIIVSPLIDTNGAISNYILTLKDVTEKKRIMDDLIAAKDKAEESDRLKTAFLHNISHEIRTPMNAIVGFSELLDSPDISPERKQFFVETIIQNSHQLLSIINDIVSVATIEAGQIKFNENQINLNQVLQFLYKQFILQAKEKAIALNYRASLSDTEANVTTDGTKLTEILTNLIGNALKFTKYGSVTYGYNVTNDFLEFYVEDTGIGIPAEMYDEIFKRFRQVETSSTRKFGGSGLGLSISKAYV